MKRRPGIEAEMQSVRSIGYAVLSRGRYNIWSVNSQRARRLGCDSRLTNDSLRHYVQTGSGAHPASCPTSIGSPFYGDKSVETWSWLFRQFETFPLFYFCDVRYESELIMNMLRSARKYNSYKILVCKCLGKWQVERPGGRWKNNVKTKRCHKLWEHELI
jgi:hypothetical protein